MQVTALQHWAPLHPNPNPHPRTPLFSTRFRTTTRSTVATMCVVTANPPTHAVESIVLGVRDAGFLGRVLEHINAACPILCLEGATPEQFPHMLDGTPLSSLQSIRGIPPSVFRQCSSLKSVCLTNLPLLESIGFYAFSQCVRL